MEFIIPIVALGSIYFIQNKNNDENFTDNTDIPDTNFFPVLSNQFDLTSKLINDNHYNNHSTWTDNYFNPSYSFHSDSQKLTSLNGQLVSPDYFQHNNLVPSTNGGKAAV